MTLTNRTAEILRLVRLHRSCRIVDLAAQLNVSDETIRRNIRPLVNGGTVLKVHGGIMLPDRMSELPFEDRMKENREAKQRIAELTARQINHGDSLILDGGATTAYVALALTRHRELQVVTNATDIARTFLPRDGNCVYLAGGELRADDGTSFGQSTCNFVRQFHARHAILSISAINSWGLLNQQPCEAEFSQAAIKQSDRVIVVADSTKFGRDGFVKVCDLDAIDMLVTDADPPASLARRLIDADVEVLTAKHADRSYTTD